VEVDLGKGLRVKGERLKEPNTQNPISKTQNPISKTQYPKPTPNSQHPIPNTQIKINFTYLIFGKNIFCTFDA
jgi:hypothetical protein